MEAVIFDEEEAGLDVPHDTLAVGLRWCGPALLHHGDDGQRSRFLPSLLRGDEIWCQLFSEPGAGSDLAGLGTRAHRDGEEWRLTGQKAWTTFAHRSDWGLCIARHDPEAARHQGLTAFLVELASPGVSVRPLRQMTGGSNFNEVFLDDVPVPDRHRLGRVGDGWKVAITTFMYERLGVAVPTDAILARLAMELGPDPDPVTRDRLLELVVRSRVGRLHHLRTLTSLASGRPPGPEGSLTKLAATLLLSDIYRLALDATGAPSLLAGAEAPAAGAWLVAFLGTQGIRIGGGSDEIQRTIIGERVLGLPGEPRDPIAPEGQSAVERRISPGL